MKTISLSKNALRSFALMLCFGLAVPQLWAYTVAGSQTEVLGTSWDPSNTANDMTSSDGVNYTLAFTNRQLTAGNYECKVTHYNNWNESWPSNNYVYNVPSSGVYNITFSFNSSSHAVSVSVVPYVEPSEYTIYVLPNDATVPYLYLWGSNDYKPNGNWPGAQLTSTEVLADGNSWYKWTSSAVLTNSLNAIFNNNSGHQTGDITGLAPGTYYFKWNVNANTYEMSTTPPAPAVVNYYVVGADTNIFPNGWSSGAETQMSDGDDDGVYTWTTAQVHLNAGADYTYKVWASNDTWYPASGNAQFNVQTSGTYTVAFTFNPVTGEYTATPTLISADPEYEYTFYVLPSTDTTPYLYLWGSNSYHPNGNWPGSALTDTEVLADRNTWYKWTSDEVTQNVIGAIVNNGGSGQTGDITNLAPGTYYIYWNTGDNTYEITTVAPELAVDPLYMHGLYYYDGNAYSYEGLDAMQLKYDAASGIYYANNVTLVSNATFCFSTTTGEAWSRYEGTRYGYSGNEATQGEGTPYLYVTTDYINTQIPLGVWDATKGEYKMSAAGHYNVMVNIEEGWLKLVRTDTTTLSPMNVYLEQTPNVDFGETLQAPGTDYSTAIFGSDNWPLNAYNRKYGDWSAADSYHYPVKYVGDTTTVDGKTWWHWQVEASIAELFFKRTNATPALSDTIARKAGVVWYTWDENEGVTEMTDHSRQYFEASVTALPSIATVKEGHYYVYFVNTVGWTNVYCYAWLDNGGSYVDGYGHEVQGHWPGQRMEKVGLDPVTGYEVWCYDLGPINSTTPPDGILFNDGNTNPDDDSKEQTGDFVFVNGGVFDYLGLVDGKYTLNNIIREGYYDVRYTITHDLLGVYYDKDARTKVYYTDENGNDTYEIMEGALYAKDLNLYGEKSVMPDDSYTDYIYDICASPYTAGRSQVQDKRTSYDQSNWVKLVVSPNYDGGGNLPVARSQRPNLASYVDHIIPANTLHMYMIDSINPTARVMKIELGDAMRYEPNVYISTHFNDSVVYHYTHQDWQLGDTLPIAYRTQPVINWNFTVVDGDSIVTGGTAQRRPVYDPAHAYKMFYVAPKPQEVAYITWVVYTNDNTADGQGIKPYGADYDPQYYYPETPTASFLPADPGRFFCPANWNRNTPIPASKYDNYKYLSEDELTDSLGGYGTEFGYYSNGYVQSGGFEVNWSLFGDSIGAEDHMSSSGHKWWQIFRPGQAYKIKAIIRYSRGGDTSQSNWDALYQPSNGDNAADEYDEPNATAGNAPRRAGGVGGDTPYPNMYYTGNFEPRRSKFIIFPIDASPTTSNGDGLGNVTVVDEVVAPASAQVVSVRYYNMMGIEGSKPFDGINIVVTTYSDGTRSSKKILR